MELERKFEIVKFYFSRFALWTLEALFKRGDGGGIRTKKINFKISKFLYTYLVENLILIPMCVQFFLILFPSKKG